MVNKKVINFRVTDEQYRLIHLRMRSEGFVSLSRFIREMLLKEDLYTRNMIKEIHEAVVKKN